MRLLAEVVSILQTRGVPHALIGAGAMAVHGIARSTFDLDLLVVDASVLDQHVWETLRRGGTAIDLRRGDAEEPLVGVARFERADDRSLDLIVGRLEWQRRAIDRSQRASIGGMEVPVVTAADLVLLKLYAGGPQDAWDIEQMLSLEGSTALRAAVEAAVAQLPPDSLALWRRIVP